MRRILVVIQTVVILIGTNAAVSPGAGNPDTGPGCGLGKLAWQDYKGQKEIAPQVMMATTNGTFGSTTFGISFGTSGCTNNGVIMGEMKVQAFTETMVANLSQDMARGSGEHLTSLATLLGIPPHRRNDFFAGVQERYADLLHAGEPPWLAMTRAIGDATVPSPTVAKVSGDR